ncbi:hypothetical protein dqs_2718 [Azoarcus olearius]|uniref:hypothetical protein n=1 Tax=Azoarcus sp. (strain BH72) TaxID=418699 RepID=UPI0008063617|nr:hypothetical protein [Azoarcus olearius]ANQ85748.1 hypothetical protein dqs_2718 [Azoarcus olearius]
MKTMTLRPLALQQRDGTWVRQCEVRREGDGEAPHTAALWFESEASIPPPDDDDCDSYVLATVMEAMREDRALIVEGRVSHRLLSNLTELQWAWAKWRPRLYRPVEIHVDHEVRAETAGAAAPGAVCAFSGGVDATFSVWRHSQGLAGYRSQDIRFCALVHGFDIPLAEHEAFERARRRATATLADIGLNLVPIRTNYREVARASWEHSFSCALVSVLVNFRRVAGACLVGSSEPYDSLVIPWGSSPITDHLLGTEGFEVIHDGASHSRTEKVGVISGWKAGAENLRVCWEGDLKDANCGQCEKCLRTRLNFLATGQQPPGSLRGADLMNALRHIRLRNDAVRAEWRQIYEYAVAHGVHGDWVDYLPRLFDAHADHWLGRLIPAGSVGRRWINRLLQG